MDPIPITRIQSNGTIVLDISANYVLTINLGPEFVKFVGGNSSTTVDGQGHTITAGTTYVGADSPIVLQNIVLVNLVTLQQWGMATTDTTCQRFDLSGTPISVAIAVEDTSYTLICGNIYSLSNGSSFNDTFVFDVSGSGNVLVLGNGTTITTSLSGLFQSEAANQSIMIQDLNVTYTGAVLEGENGCIFRQGFANMIAKSVTISFEGCNANVGGIFPGNNGGFVVAENCSSSVNSYIRTADISGGGGGMCGGNNRGIVNISHCSTNVTEYIDNNDNGGGGGMCGGNNSGIVNISNCSANVAGSINNNGDGGGGGMCGGKNSGIVNISNCSANLGGFSSYYSLITNSANGGGGGICGGNNSGIVNISNCSAIGMWLINNDGDGGGGGICGGKNSGTIRINLCNTNVLLGILNSQGHGGGGGICGGMNSGTIRINLCNTTIVKVVLFGGIYNNSQGGGGGICGGYQQTPCFVQITNCSANIGAAVTNGTIVIGAPAAAGGVGGSGGICGGGNQGTTIILTNCIATIDGGILNEDGNLGGGGGICGGYNESGLTLTISNCGVTCINDINNSSIGGGGGICGGSNRAAITIRACSVSVTSIGGGGGGGGICGGGNASTIFLQYCNTSVSGTIDNHGDGGGGGICGGNNLVGATITIQSSSVSVSENIGGGGGGVCGGYNTGQIHIVACVADISGTIQGVNSGGMLGGTNAANTINISFCGVSVGTIAEADDDEGPGGLCGGGNQTNPSRITNCAVYTNMYSANSLYCPNASILGQNSYDGPHT